MSLVKFKAALKANYTWLILAAAAVALAWLWRKRCDDRRRRGHREGFLPLLLGMPSLAASLIPMFGKKKKPSATRPPFVPPPGPPVVVVYKDAKFEGMDKFFGVGDYPDLGSWSDAISSLRVPKGLKLTLYQKTNFEGKKLEMPGGWNHPHLSLFAFDDNGTYIGRDVCGSNNSGCWNDTASSMKVTTM